MEDIRELKKDIVKELLGKKIDLHKLKRLLYLNRNNINKATSKF